MPEINSPDVQVSPEVQRSRDDATLQLLQQELKNNPDNQQLQRDIAQTQARQDSGNPWQGRGNEVGRGTQISAELKARRQNLSGPLQNVSYEPMTMAEASGGMSGGASYEPMFPEEAAPTGKASEQGAVSKMGEAFMTGLLQSGKELTQAGDALHKQLAPEGKPPKDYQQPITAEDFLHPSKLGPKVALQLGSGLPVMAGGIAGAVGASIVAPELPGVAAIAGGAIGAAAVASYQSLYPYFEAEYKASPNDPDGALDRAVKKAVTDGVFTGLGWAAFGWVPYKSFVKNLLVQGVAVQPTVAVAGKATQNVISGQPVGEGVPEVIPGAITGTVVPLAGVHGAKMAVGAIRSKPAEPPRPGEPAKAGAEAGPAPPEAGATAAEEPAAPRPTGPVQPEGLPLLYPKGETYGHTPERLQPGEQPIEYTPRLAPLEQARADAEVLKHGGVPADADDVRLRNASLIAVYGENAAVRHAIESPGLSAIGDAMLAIAPKVEQVRQTLKRGQENRDITSDIMTAVDELARIKAAGMSVDQVMAHGLPHEVSFEGQELLRFLDQHAGDPQVLSRFMENYLQIVQDVGGVPSELRGRAFDIIAERNMAKREAEAAAAHAQVEGTKEKQTKSEAQIATEQMQGERALTEIAKARAAGHGIQPEYQTAMELAFANAKPLKGKPGEKPSPAGNEPVREGAPSAGVQGRHGGEAAPAQRAERLPVSAEPREAGNTRPVGEDGHPPRAEENVPAALTKAQLRRINVETNAIEMETGKRVQIKERADVVLKRIDHQIKTMEGLLECLS